MNETVEKGLELLRKAGEDSFPNNVYNWTIWTAPVIQSPQYLRDTLSALGFVGAKVTGVRLLSAYGSEKTFVDEPIILELDSGERLELEFPAGGTVRLSRSRLPRTLKSACAFDANERFAAVVGQKIMGFEVGETGTFPTNALYFEQTLQRGEKYIESVSVWFENNKRLKLTCGLDEAVLEII